MVDTSTAKRLVQAIIDNLEQPVPGRRPVHTIGVGVKGEFVASDVARDLLHCRALQRKARQGVGEVLQRIGRGEAA